LRLSDAVRVDTLACGMAIRHVAVAAIAALALLASLALVEDVPARADAAVTVTVFGDSVATAMEYDPSAKSVLARGVDLRLETAACRRLGDTSCPYDGVRPPNVIDRATQLGAQIGPVVVVAVGYNDYEANYAKNIDDAMAVFRKAGVQRVLWVTLLEERQSWADMNDMIRAAARKYPEITVIDWNAVAKQQPEWLQPDGVHLTAAGAEGMAATIEATLVQLGIAPKVPPAAAPAKALLITSRTLPRAHLRRSYTARLVATGGKAPYRWVKIGGTLAPGLRLTATGGLVGVPKRTGTFAVRIRLVDGAGTARSRVFKLRVL
jgi:hypothetical protein